MKAGKKRRPTSDAVEVLHRRYYEGKPERLANLEKARADDHVARKIYALRTEAGLTQRQLAKLVGPRHPSSADSRMPTMRAILWLCSTESLLP